MATLPGHFGLPGCEDKLDIFHSLLQSSPSEEFVWRWPDPIPVTKDLVQRRAFLTSVVETPPPETTVKAPSSQSKNFIFDSDNVVIMV